jgi:hypothetical protein
MNPAEASVLLVCQALRDGGLSVETSDDQGRIAFRTFFQLDGDIIFWISKERPEDEITCFALAEQHWGNVSKHMLDIEKAILSLESDAQTWVERVRKIGLLTAIFGTAGSSVSFMRAAATGVSLVRAAATPAFIFSFSLITFGVVLRYFALPLIRRYILRHVKSWI